jgi:hypothetical protein
MLYWMLCFTFTGGPSDVNTRDHRRRALVTHVSPCESAHVPDFRELSNTFVVIDIDEFSREADALGARAMKCGEGAIIKETRDYPRGVHIINALRKLRSCLQR